jgi:hypothetical protein
MPVRLQYAPEKLVAMARSDAARQKAVEAAHQALLLDPKDPGALLVVAEGALLEGKGALAQAALARLTAQQPGGLPVLLRAQALWVEDGSRREALALLQPVLGDKDVLPEALVWAGGLEVLSGDAAAAKALLQRAVEAEPQFAAARLDLGAALLLEDDVEGALDQLQRARAINSAVPELAFDRGLALLSKPIANMTDEARLQEAQKAFSAYVALGGYRSALVDPALAEVARQMSALKR